MSDLNDGVLISLEGLPCCGATKQANRFFIWLDDMDIEPLQARTPGGTPLGREINHLLTNRPDIRSHIVPRTELLLLQSDITQLYAETVLPAIHHNKFVFVQEGGIVSILAHASLYTESDAELLAIKMNNFAAVQGRVPDLTIFLDCTIETIQTRARNLFRNYPYVGHELHLMRESFLVQSTLDPEHIKVINGENSPEAIFNDILFYVKPLLRKKGYEIGE